MLSGQNYDSRDKELITQYHKARKLFQEYNRLESKAMARRNQLLDALLKYKGEGVWIEAPFFCDYGEHISIGENTFINANCFFLDNNTINIGKNSLIGPYVQIYTAMHPLKASERIVDDSKRGTFYLTATRPVSIGDQVWIGGNSVIMPGVSIGNGTTIGAGSIVTKDIPDNVLALGNPCKVVRKL